MKDSRRIVMRLVAISIPAMAAAALVGVVLVEAWVRLSWDSTRGTPGFYVSDPVRGQRLAENYTGWFAGVPVHTNSLGFRDPREYDLNKKPNTFRVLVLGDSVTFGHGTVYEHTYPFLVEQRLKTWRPDVDWQVWNAAVPGYNTSQELAQLVELGPRVKPDLVVVGFYENDVADNKPLVAPTLARRVAASVGSFARRHLYSLELYKRLYLDAAWRLSSSDAYRQRLEYLDTERSDQNKASGASGAAVDPPLTPYDWLSDDEVRATACSRGMKATVEPVRAIQRDPNYHAWLDAVRRFGALQKSGQYQLVFFLNIVPPICPDGDEFYDATRLINAFYLSVFSPMAPTVSCHDAFLHVRPSQMPKATAHAVGNSNVVKADVLFKYLRDVVLPGALDATLAGRSAS